MQKITVAVVEDEIIIADSICAALEDLGYRVPEPCASYSEAVDLFRHWPPDLVIVDIHLAGEPDGIKLGEHLTGAGIPFIFLTANSDSLTVQRAKVMRPSAYLVKPFQRADLYAAIEVALHNALPPLVPAATRSASPAAPSRRSLFVKEGAFFCKVEFDEILYLSSDHVYVTLHTAARKYLVRASMQQYLDRLEPFRFRRVHRSYAVNLDKIDRMGTEVLYIGAQEIPVSRAYRDTLLQELNIL